MLRAPLAALVLTVGLAGCALVPEGPGPRAVEGPTDGYTPTASYLKVFVRSADGNLTLADFDRRDWHVAKIADQLDRKEIRYLSAHGTAREILGEVVIEEVRQPSGLAKLSYAAMAPTPEERRLYDLEYDRILARLAATTPTPEGAPPALPPVGLG